MVWPDGLRLRRRRGLVDSRFIFSHLLSLLSSNAGRVVYFYLPSLYTLLSQLCPLFYSNEIVRYNWSQNKNSSGLHRPRYFIPRIMRFLLLFHLVLT